VNPRRHELACPVQARERVMRPHSLGKTFLAGTPKRRTKFSSCLFPSLCSYLRLAWTRVTELSTRVATRFQQILSCGRQTDVASVGEQVYLPSQDSDKHEGAAVKRLGLSDFTACAAPGSRTGCKTALEQGRARLPAGCCVTLHSPGRCTGRPGNGWLPHCPSVRPARRSWACLALPPMAMRRSSPMNSNS
jgi:hypothetical protein